jgi:hypothetical protein
MATAAYDVLMRYGWQVLDNSLRVLDAEQDVWIAAVRTTFLADEGQDEQEYVALGQGSHVLPLDGSHLHAVCAWYDEFQSFGSPESTGEPSHH